MLTGTLGDGASGLRALKECGGLTLVQDPGDAAFPEMPATALRLARPHHVVDLRAMPDLLAQLVKRPAGPPVQAPQRPTWISRTTDDHEPMRLRRGSGRASRVG